MQYLIPIDVTLSAHAHIPPNSNNELDMPSQETELPDHPEITPKDTMLLVRGSCMRVCHACMVLIPGHDVHGADPRA